MVPFDPELDDEQFDTFDEMPVDGVMVTYRVRYGPPLAALYQIELSRLQLTAKKDMMALEEQLRAKGYWRSLETA